MTAGTPRWSADDLAYLHEHYNITPAAEIAAVLGRTIRAIHNRGAKAGLTSRQPRHPCTYFQRIDSPVKAYILGLLVADGWVDDENRVGIDLEASDREAVAVVRDELCPAGRLRVYERKRGRSRVRFQFGNGQLAADLARHGVVPRKTGLEAWPSALPAEFENSFICGYYDGDGHMDWLPRPYWQVCCASRSFLDAMKQHIETALGVTPFGPYRQSSIWAIGKSGEPARKILAWIHQEVPGLARKRLPKANTPADQVVRLPRRVARVTHALMTTWTDAGGSAPVTAAEVCVYDSEALSVQSTGTALAYARKLRLADSAPGGPDGVRLWWPSDGAWELRRSLEERVLAEQQEG